jgi:hypothetical protein
MTNRKKPYAQPNSATRDAMAALDILIQKIMTAIHKAELINRIDASFLDEDSWRELNESLREHTALIRPST